MNRLRAWLAETHPVRFELIRHFFLRFFDSEFVSTPGQWRVVAGGVLAVLLSSSIFIVPGYFHKYRLLTELDDPAPYRLAATADVLFITVAAMLVMGLLTTLQWSSLFPSLRDYLALASLPIRPRDLFIAKFAALVLMAMLFNLAIPLNTSVTLPWLQSGRYAPPAIPQIAANFVATSLASLFVFFTLIAFQGLLLNLVPVRLFERISLAIQAAILVLLLCAVPLALSIPNLHARMESVPYWAPWVPPLWYLGLHGAMTGSHDPAVTRLAQLAVWGVAASALAAVGTYLWSFRRHRRRLLESAARSGTDPWSGPSRLAAALLPEPPQLAVFSFIAKTLARSPHHRLILSAFTALALALIVESFLGLSAAKLAAAAASVPLALSLFMLAGYRYLFRLPVELRANWLFRVNEQGNRLLFLGAAEKFLVAFAILPVTLATLPLEIALLGFAPGLTVTVLCLMPALVLTEVLLFEFDQVPFTSSYLPGRRPVIETLIIYGVLVTAYVMLLGAFIAWSLNFASWAAGLFVALAAILWRVRAARRDHWQEGRLEFEELPEKAVLTLNIDHD